ncbi:MAG: phosphoribosylformylglycinamidine synthase, partial [Planctomycetes bacterium]|nr:phosphoribosylformylglycinamidine synthase [Planctomycetota bacterium]
MQAWRVEVRLRDGLPDPAGNAARHALIDAGLALAGPVHSHRGYLLGAALGRAEVERFAREVLTDPVSEQAEILAPDEDATARPGEVRVVPRPGVTDQVAHSVQQALADCGLEVVPTGTWVGYRVTDSVRPDELRRAASAALANDVIQEVTTEGPPAGLPGAGGEPDLDVHEVAIRSLEDAALVELSKSACLALNLREMQTVQRHYESQGREPTQAELETIAQTWSEHCKHKTLTGRIKFGSETIDNLLKTEIAGVTNDLKREFCVSVFVDNAGVIDFDEDDCVCIKVETHNQPSAIEPFGGAGTGVGGVIRDVLGTGLAARPVASTDVFCVAPLDMRAEDVPDGCMHPQRILRGVVAGVRDYGNPMGIPTVHGAVHFDPDFVGNPLVYVGNVGMIPRDKVAKQANAGDVIVSIGGRTGRDGIHGATFSSAELHEESETVSAGAVQIGNPIEEKRVLDGLLRA